MVRAAALACAVLLIAATNAVHAQTGAAADLVSSWLLVAAERDVASGQPRRVTGARGLLILDGAGNVFEFFTVPSGDAPPRSAAQRVFADNGGFWGRYVAVPAAGRIDFEAEEGVSPNVRGLKFSRRYELAGDRLIVTSTDEPQAQRDVRLTWQRVPTVEHLSPAYREVVGFWRHVEEARLNTVTGELDSRREVGLLISNPNVARQLMKVFESDWLESIHDGSIFGDGVKLGVFFPTAIGLVLLWLGGIWMFVWPYIAKARMRRRKALAATLGGRPEPAGRM